MKVLLKEDIDSLGYAGEVHKVANGFARNYLLPRGLAEAATPTALKKADAWRTRAETRREQVRAEYDALSEKIAAATLEFSAKAGDSGKLYGSVTTQSITDALNELLGTEIDRRHMISDPLRTVGEHMVTVRLDRDHQPKFKVTVLSEGGDEEVEEEVVPGGFAQIESEFDEEEDEDLQNNFGAEG